MSNADEIPPPNPYVPGVCWFGTPVPGHKKDVRPCGIDADLYIVKGVVKGNTGGFNMRIWLCTNHFVQMSKTYSVTLVTSNRACNSSPPVTS